VGLSVILPKESGVASLLPVDGPGLGGSAGQARVSDALFWLFVAFFSPGSGGPSSGTAREVLLGGGAEGT
jgi:hypothetical protein